MEWIPNFLIHAGSRCMEKEVVDLTQPGFFRELDIQAAMVILGTTEVRDDSPFALVQGESLMLSPRAR